MKVLVLGDACIDEYRYGNITRVNPESTATLLSYARSEERLGMAHNVAENLIAFGLEVEIQVPTEVSRKIRYIDQRTRHHLLRVDIDCVCKPYEIESTYDFDAIVISDYNKGFLNSETIIKIRERFNGPIYMDTKKTDLAKFQGIFLKINELEYNSAVSLPSNDYTIVTYGSSGCKYMYKMYPCDKIEIVDVCGAGDVFLAAMVAKHLETGDMEIALPFANKKAALSCQSLGTVCVS